ncbi:hypothetical protein GQ457_03G014650 [Hibiscus cannabinus]
MSVDMCNSNLDVVSQDGDGEQEEPLQLSELKDNRFMKKYASIADLQDKALSEKKTRKRDHALKRYKKLQKENFPRKLVDYSPTNSDIARKQILTKSARRTLEVGKMVVFVFMGEKEEVVTDFVRLESHFHM